MNPTTNPNVLKPKRPGGITTLSVIFTFVAIQEIGTFMDRSSFDAQLFGIYNLQSIQMVSSLVIVVLGFILAYTFWKGKSVGYKLSFWFFGIIIIYSAIALIVGFLNRDILVQLYPSSRAFDSSLFNIIAFGTLIAVIAFFAYCSYYVRSKQSYFLK